MSLRGLLRSRVAFWIYVVGLAQIVVVAAGFAVMIYAEGPPPSPHERDARLVARLLEPTLADPAALEERVRLLAAEFGGCVSVADPRGALVASSEPEPCRCAGAPGAPPPAEAREAHCRVASVSFPDGGAGRVELTNRRAHPSPPRPTDFRVIAFVLLVVGISSWLLARWLTRPLSRLSAAAQAFGAGELSARTGINRSDELGDVGRAFDEMASRVTELLRTEKELLANVSHELRTPLARVRVALDLAAEGDAEMARESLADIVDDLDELERLIGDVLMAARMDLSDEAAPSGLPRMRREDVDPGELLHHAASRFRAAHATRPLKVEIAEDLATIHGDAVLLRRVFENLLENAHKYTERPTEPVDLRARPRRRGHGKEGRPAATGRRLELSDAPMGVEIEVVDRGIGIAPTDLPRVCEPFFRADRSRTRATGGLGLGLALAKRIVEAHGGAIELASELGEGTVVRIWLPARAPIEGTDRG